MSLDQVVYPEMLWEFFYNRSVTSMMMLVLGFTVMHVKDSRVVRLLTHVVVMLPFISISYMIFLVDGANSPYYAGLNLVLMGAALIVKWGFKDGVVNAIISLLIFAFTLKSYGSTWGESFIPLYFVFVTAAIVCMGNYMYGARRFREFCLIQEVEEANLRLEGNNKRLKAMDETKSRFFANISHELRTPLTLILGPTENLRMQSKYENDDELTSQLGIIEQNALRLLRLINDILDLVKLDSDESTPRPESIEVTSFISGLTQNINSIASIKGVNLSNKNMVPEGKCVWLDRDRLEKILLNLVVNAIKFTPSGGHVEIEARLTSARELVITVSDSGQGMSEEDVQNVFVRFWQADMSAKRKHRGAGIGLALVKSLADSMGGKVSVQSELGEGTIFTVNFPSVEVEREAINLDVKDKEKDVLEKFNERARWEGAVIPMTTAEQDVELPQSLPPVVTEESKELSNKTILVADDEDSMRKFIVSRLDSDYRVIQTIDGLDAWNKIQEHKPDLLVLDMMMPHMDGIELAAKVRADSSLSRIPIVLVTAQASEKPRLRALAAGVNDFITKPFSTIELQARIKNLLLGSDFEQQLHESNIQLENAYGQLKEQRAILVQTEKLTSLGRMSAGIVHEVNNPLNYARTALHALSTFDRQLPEEEKEDFVDVLGDAKEGVDRVIGIVSDLRAFTRGDHVA
ncbi:MAG: histidine kinase dimerization/phospho-acceptor domain-containing protein, partial [Akkermansiaceae bacterium]